MTLPLPNRRYPIGIATYLRCQQGQHHQSARSCRKPTSFLARALETMILHAFLIAGLTFRTLALLSSPSCLSSAQNLKFVLLPADPPGPSPTFEELPDCSNCIVNGQEAPVLELGVMPPQQEKLCNPFSLFLYDR